MGIGTLLVFVAMVLVAAIAAGILVETAGFLQSRSEKTGEQSGQQVTNRVELISKLGHVGPADEVVTIYLKIKKSPGAGDVNVSNLSVHWVGPGGSADLPPPDVGTPFSVDAISGSIPVMTSTSDVFELAISLPFDPISRPMKEDETAILKITTPSGGTTRAVIRPPVPLEGPADVEL